MHIGNNSQKTKFKVSVEKISFTHLVVRIECRTGHWRADKPRDLIAARDLGDG